MLFELSRRLDAPVDVISRSDSTLRGHVIAEVTALDAVRREVLGRGYDGVLLIPAYLEAGRFTAGDVHWARVGGEPLPVGETEFARDATFGFSASNLREFVAEKSGGTIRPDQVHSITLDDIRRGGPQRVAEILADVTDGAFVVVNAVEYADLDVVVLGLLEAEAAGKSFLYRTGPSFAQPLAGLDPQPPLQASDIWPGGRPGRARPGRRRLPRRPHQPPGGGGPRTRRHHRGRARRPRRRRPGPPRRPRRRHHRPGGGRARRFRRAAVHQPHPACATPTPPPAWRSPGRCPPRSSRSSAAPWRPSPPGSSPRAASPRTTSPSAAWASAAPTVLGQLLPGLVSVFRPVEALPQIVGTPYVVFAGNVGDENTLAYVIDLFSGRTAQ